MIDKEKEMNLKFMLIVTAVLDLLIGIAFILVPGPATGLLGLQLGPVGQSLIRLLGCGMLSLGMITYQLRNVNNPQVVRALLRSLFTGSLVATVIMLFGQAFLFLNSALVAMLEKYIGPMPKGGLLILVFLVLLIMTVVYGILLSKSKVKVAKTSQQPA
jgi:hypothetical protein